MFKNNSVDAFGGVIYLLIAGPEPADDWAGGCHMSDQAQKNSRQIG
jgi:hypothetical protein